MALTKVTDSLVDFDSLSITSGDNTSSTNIARFAANNDSLAIGIGYESIRQTETGGVLKFETNGAERMRIDSSGNVGIGTSSPTSQLTLSAATPSIQFTDTDNNADAYIQGTDGNLRFFADDSQEASSSMITFAVDGSEHMRIDSSGRFLVNTTSASTLVTIQGDTTADVMTVRTGSNANNNVGAIVFRDGAQEYCGQIVVNGQNNTTGYTTSSDYRLKENVDYTWDATTRLKQLRPARFNWISDPTDTLIDGFLAHEVSDIVPEAITGEKDATETYTDEDGNEQTTPIYQGIDQAKLVPLLVKTIQELEARITTLENA